MTLRRIFITAAVVGITLASSALALAQTRPPTVPKTGYAPVNGLKLYYEIHGSGEPLVLLHGGLGATEMFNEIMPSLSNSRQVIAVDLQGHGRTADVDRPLSYESMADDIAALIKYLGIEKADVMGYSLGGGVALRTAIQHPDLVRKLVIVSATFKRDGWYPEILAGMSQMGPGAAEPMKQTPMYQMYARIAPKPADWPVLITKLGDLVLRVAGRRPEGCRLERIGNVQCPACHFAGRNPLPDLRIAVAVIHGEAVLGRSDAGNQIGKGNAAGRVQQSARLGKAVTLAV